MELRRRDIEEAVARAGDKPLLVLTDYDGTLAPIVRHPNLARLPEPTCKTLFDLSATGAVVFAVISGRPLAELASHIPVPAILAGNHGLEIRVDGRRWEHPLATERAPLLEKAAGEAAAVIARWPGAWVENKRLNATIHYREVALEDRRALRMKVRGATGRYGSALGLRAGKCSLELHPRIGWNKGNAVDLIREHVSHGACLCFGDDTTDEAMFRALDGELTVSVGVRPGTAARYRVADPAGVGQALRMLLECLPRTVYASRS